jgi:hypothetical protein
MPHPPEAFAAPEVPSDLALPLTDVARQPAEGLSWLQEPKYTVNGSAIINRATGEPIPQDVPVFIIRANDPYAVPTLTFYASLIARGPSTHLTAVMSRIGDFLGFKSDHPNRMKAHPDTVITNRPVEARTEAVIGYAYEWYGDRGNEPTGWFHAISFTAPPTQPGRPIRNLTALIASRAPVTQQPGADEPRAAVLETIEASDA